MSSEANLRIALKEIAKKQEYENYSLKIKPVSTEGANYTSKLFSVKITAPTKQDLHLFAKVISVGEHMRGMMGDFLKDNEMNFYQNILPMFERFQDEYNVRNQDKLRVPKFYGHNPAYVNDVIVLEDMCALGYTTFDRFTTADWSYAASAMDELAKWYALVIACERNEPEKFKVYTENCVMGEELITYMNKHITLIFESGLDIINEENRDKIEQFFKRCQENNVDFVRDFSKPLKRPVLIHGDYRPNNLVHKVNDDGTCNITILDFQTLRLGNLVSDIVYFIITCTDEKFRKDNFTRLLDHFYTQLGLSLQKINIDVKSVYPKEDFQDELKEVLPLGLATAILLLPVITISPEDAFSIGQGEEMKVPQNQLFIERINGLVNDFVKWKIL